MCICAVLCSSTLFNNYTFSYVLYSEKVLIEYDWRLYMDWVLEISRIIRDYQLFYGMNNDLS
jgi:hypothetical protein